jgi:23S rRNA pseudouridine955/2504/2580 synthase
MQQVNITKDFTNLRLDKFLCQKYDISFGVAQKIVREKNVRVNGARVDAAYKTNHMDEISIYADVNIRTNFEKTKVKISDAKIAKIKEQIIFRDENIIALNKPSGLATQGGSGIDISVDDYLPYLKFGSQENPQLVHRLDKDTSGLLLIARNSEAAEVLTAAFKNKTIRKTYLALVIGLPKKAEGVINIPICKKFVGKNEKVYRDEIDGKEAITEFKVLEKFTEHSLLELSPLTGRTHQLRVHCKELGHAIIGDVKYGGRDVIKRDIARRVCLHAKKIVMEDFFGKKLELETPLPDFLIPAEPKEVSKGKTFEKSSRKEKESYSGDKSSKPEAKKGRGARRGYGRRKDAIRIAKK